MRLRYTRVPTMTLEEAAARRTQTWVYLALTFQTLISAGTYLAAKRAMVEIPPFTLVQVRFLISAVAFLAILTVLPGQSLPKRGQLARVAWLGFLAGPLNQGLFFHGLSQSSSAHAALLYALTPIGVFLVAVARREEHVRRRGLMGIVLAFSGVVVLLMGRGLASGTGSLKGDVFILGAVASWVLYTIDSRKLIAEVGAIRATAFPLVAGTVMLLPFTPFLFAADAVRAASPVALACALFLALITSVVSYILWSYALSKTAPSKVAVFSNLQPLATALAAWAILGEPLTWEIAVGGVMVIAGVRLAQSRQ